MTPSDDVAAYMRFLVIRSMPMLVVDLDVPDAEGPAQLEGGLFQTLTERGLAMMPGLYDEPLPKGAQVGLTLSGEELRLEDEQETRLLRLPREAVDEEWSGEALRMKGTMLYVGRNLDMHPELSPKGVCDLLEEAAGADRVAGAIVGVAEQSPDLSMLG